MVKQMLNAKPNLIRNKQKRYQVLHKRKQAIKKLKRKTKKKDDQQKKQPITIEDKREFNQTFVFEPTQQQIQQQKIDQLEPILNSTQIPNILLTSSQNPSLKLYDFMKQLKLLIPNIHYYPKKNYSLQKICQYSTHRYTHVMCCRQDKNKMNQIIIKRLPQGPQAVFRVTSVELNKEIFHHAAHTLHLPELILHNFNTLIGKRVGRLLASMFPQNPQFKGRRVITFKNQRDFIFLRHHRYMFNQQGKKVHLQQIGPRLTLKLLSIQKQGIIQFASESKMYVKRNRIYI